VVRKLRCWRLHVKGMWGEGVRWGKWACGEARSDVRRRECQRVWVTKLLAYPTKFLGYKSLNFQYTLTYLTKFLDFYYISNIPYY
jgi:hypothetical protein